MRLAIGTLVQFVDNYGTATYKALVIDGNTVQVVTADEDAKLIRLPRESRVAQLAEWRGSVSAEACRRLREETG